MARVENSTSRKPASRRQLSKTRHDGMADQSDLVEIVHPGAAEGAVGSRETGRFDQMRLDAEAGAKPQNRAGILGNIGLVKCDAHAASATAPEGEIRR